MILYISFPVWKVFVDTGYNNHIILKGIANYLTITMNLLMAFQIIYLIVSRLLKE